MARKSYVTNMPDKTGAFLTASRIIARHGGNITRVSYNKAVDLHTLFLDVEAPDEMLGQIEKELESIGYLKNKVSETSVLKVVVKIPDLPGALLPVLKILDRYDINISYINLSETDSEYQDFKMGLLIENPTIVKMLIDEISELYHIDISEYDNNEENLDNTIFYIRLANDMQKLFGLSNTKTMEFISESNRILQMLQEKGEDPGKVFRYIRRFAYFISRHRGSDFAADIDKIDVAEGITLYNIQPPCGSNTYVFDTGEEYVMVDTGYAIYAEEMNRIFHELFSDWDIRSKRIYITHADVDHCGLLSMFPEARICLNQKSAESLKHQKLGIPDYREMSALGLGYSKLSRIISGYMPPDDGKFEIMDSNTPEKHAELLHIADFRIGSLPFEVYEGSGGHLYGEMVFLCREYGIIFTGDLLVNISGFSKERAEFNSLAPYLMTSVNVDSSRAADMRHKIVDIIEETKKKNMKHCIICSGHGPIFTCDASGKI